MDDLLTEVAARLRTTPYGAMTKIVQQFKLTNEDDVIQQNMRRWRNSGFLPDYVRDYANDLLYGKIRV